MSVQQKFEEMYGLNCSKFAIKCDDLATKVFLQIFDSARQIGLIIDPKELYLQLEKCNIKGELIWTFYNDVCRQNVRKMIDLLRAYERGILSSATLLHAIQNCGLGINFDDLLNNVEQEEFSDPTFAIIRDSLNLLNDAPMFQSVIDLWV